MMQLTLDDAMEDPWSPSPHVVSEARACLRRIQERGGASYYSEAHRAARLHLRFFEPEPVRCARCPTTEATISGLVNGIHAALDWENVPAERLRVDYAGRIFSVAPELDYIPLCRRCHRRYDSWRKALPDGIQMAPALQEAN